MNDDNNKSNNDVLSQQISFAHLFLHYVYTKEIYKKLNLVLVDQKFTLGFKYTILERVKCAGKFKLLKILVFFYKIRQNRPNYAKKGSYGGLHSKLDNSKSLL